MSTFDVRDNAETVIDTILFADDGDHYTTVASLSHQGDYVKIYDEDQSQALKIESKQQAVDMIKALNKAIELEWFVR